MKKMALVLLGLSSVVVASELEYGKGTFSMTGGFLGLTGTIDTDVTTYSLVERHSNIGDFFYSYDFTWYDSSVLKQTQHTYNDMASMMSIPEMEHRLKGLDANIRIGYDVIHEDQDNFLGLGVLVGVSIPWLDSSKSDDDSNDDDSGSSDSIFAGAGDMVDTDDMFKDSKTEIMTYKIGPTINFQRAFNKNLSIYGIGSYAYQTGYVKNDYADSDFTVNGTFQEYNLGLYFTPFTETYKWGWLSLSPRLYATVGYKYSKWDVDEMVIDISGNKMSSDLLSPLAMEFGMESSVGYVGVGYSF